MRLGDAEPSEPGGIPVEVVAALRMRWSDFKLFRRDRQVAMTDDSIIGRYARVVIDNGTGPLRRGLRLACRLTGLTTPLHTERRSVLRGEVVSNDADGPLPSALLDASLIITPEDPDISESRMLEGGSFRATLGLVTLHGDLVGTGGGALLRISDEIPYEGSCPACQGWKVCEDCGGTGGEPNAACPFCRGSGHCTRCAGLGVVTESS